MDTPFAGISELQKNKLFKLLETHIFTFNKNQEILSTIKGKDIICILLEGHANIVNIDYDGDETLVEELFENSVVGSGISDMTSSECQIRANEFSKVQKSCQRITVY